MLGAHEFEVPPALADVERAVSRSLAESRAIGRDYLATSRKLNRTLLRNRRLRAELRAEHAAPAWPGETPPG
jgi:hypothetical protein